MGLFTWTGKNVKGSKHHSKLTELFSNQYLIRPLKEQKFHSLREKSLLLALWLIFPLFVMGLEPNYYYYTQNAWPFLGQKSFISTILDVFLL